jgi:hypothetical protein
VRNGGLTDIFEINSHFVTLLIGPRAAFDTYLRPLAVSEDEVRQRLLQMLSVSSSTQGLRSFWHRWGLGYGSDYMSDWMLIDRVAKASQGPLAVIVLPSIEEQAEPSIEEQVEAAFAPGAKFSVGDLKSISRSRVTSSGRQIKSLDVLSLTPLQRQAAAKIHGQIMPPALQQVWQNTVNAREQAGLARIQYLLLTGRRDEAVALARETVFANHRNRFWAAVRRDTSSREWFEDTGMVFPPSKRGPPVYLDPSTGAVLDFMSIEHSNRLADNPLRCVDPTNLQFVLGDENSYFLEWIRNNDPFQKH